MVIVLSFLSYFRRIRKNHAGPPCAPPGVCVYAVGDIHGEVRLLDRLLVRLRADMEVVRAEGDEVALVFLGDYVDRGHDSRGVLERLLDLPATLPPGCRCRFLRGNHEAAMEDFLRVPARGGDWLAFGGTETLASYGIPALADGVSKGRLHALAKQLETQLPQRHRDFLRGLENSAVYGDYVFVHAGVRPGLPLERQKVEDLLWIREPFLSSMRRGERTVVHGHTVTEAVEVHPDEEAPIRIGIDTGAYASGMLSAIRLRGVDRRIFHTGEGAA